MDKIRRLILARIEERGIDMKHLSLKMGMNDRYGIDEMEREELRVYGRVVGYFRWRG